MTTEQYRLRLVELRHEIDDVDDRILEVLVERFRLTREIGILKRDGGLGPTDPAREQQLYDRVRREATDRSIDPDVVESLYRALLSHVVVEHEAIARGEAPTSL